METCDCPGCREGGFVFAKSEASVSSQADRTEAIVSLFLDRIYEHLEKGDYSVVGLLIGHMGSFFETCLDVSSFNEVENG